MISIHRTKGPITFYAVRTTDSTKRIPESDTFSLVLSKMRYPSNEWSKKPSQLIAKDIQTRPVVKVLQLRRNRDERKDVGADFKSPAYLRQASSDSVQARARHSYGTLANHCGEAYLSIASFSAKPTGTDFNCSTAFHCWAIAAFTASGDIGIAVTNSSCERSPR